MPNAGSQKKTFTSNSSDIHWMDVTLVDSPQTRPAVPGGSVLAASIRVRLDSAFVLIALIFGNALIVLNPPFQTADEAQHFFRAWQITQGEFISRAKTPLGEAGGYLPSSLDAFWQRFKPMAMHPDKNTSAHYILDSFHIPLQPEKQSLIAFGNTAHYCPIGYLPQCLGIGLGRALSLPIPMILYLGREANLLAFTLIGFLSLRYAPAIARPVFLLLLMPMMLCLAASVSADTLSCALATLFTALICRHFAAGAKSIDGKAILLVMLVSVPLSVGKVVYVPLLALLFLIPAQNFRGKARKTAVVSLLIALNLVSLIAWASATSNLDTKISTEKNISPHGQLDRLEQHPLRLATLLCNTAKDGGWFVCTTYVAVIGWMDLNFPPPMVNAYLFLLIFFCWTAGDRPPLPAPGRTALIVLPAVMVSCLGIAVLNLLYWTPLESNYILGLQGRYFIPLTPAIFLLGCSIARQIPRPADTPRLQWSLNFMVILISLMMSASLLTLIYVRFYG
jgi:uncharacterized membrane protein